VDGDRAPDFITVEGDDLSKGLPTGVRIIWNPGEAKARDPAAWQNAGRIPGTENAHYLYAECHDVNGDGDLDLLANVEEHYHRGPDGKDVFSFSVVWFKNPVK